MMLRSVAVFLLLILSDPLALLAQPDYSSVSRPWTYWWWMGSSVTREGISGNLQAMKRAGIGGVHIIPIYGEKGDEKNYIDYLSPEWMEILRFTADEAENLGMGVDMTTGTGWPFGGPEVKTEDAAKFLLIRPVNISGSRNIKECLNANETGTLVSIAAFDNKGNYSDLTSQLNTDGIIELIQNQPVDKIYALFQCPTKQKVKRSAPGGDGFVLDYFSRNSIINYMERFEKAFKNAGILKGKVRSFYNDSYEVYGANWTGDFLPEFLKRRGYDLLPYINYLADTTLNNKIRQRVITDYCETISDLIIDHFTANWIGKSHEMGMITRFQAHGSPGNLLDLYALSDIPETESFGASAFRIPGLRQDPDYEEERFGRPNPLTMKFASSAANITGRKLVSSESTTWLGDHFKVSLSQIKPQVDELFIAGINHLFFHGTTYSPIEKPFPGRLFYASTNYNQNSHFFNELPALTSYIAKCQTILQNTKPDNDILLYFPVHEIWKKQKTNNYIQLLDVHKSSYWLGNSSFGRLAGLFQSNGYTFDYISDKMIEGLTVTEGNIYSGKTRYKVLVVPSIETIPLKTLSMLRDLALKGAKIIFENQIPADIPGLNNYEKRKIEANSIGQEMAALTSDVSVKTSIQEGLSEIKIYPEELAQKGLSFIRKQSGDSTVYFITNLSDKFSEGWVDLTAKARCIEILDPAGDKHGIAPVAKRVGGTAIYLRILPGQSLILICTNKKSEGPAWEYYKPDEIRKYEIKGNWLLTPSGYPGSETPAPVIIEHTGSWTELGGKFETFSGKAKYSNIFEIPAELEKSDGFLLDLGVVRETARVRINGNESGLVWCLPDYLYIPKGIIKKKNTIEIEVTNLSLNKIIQLDKEGVVWKNYNEINFVNIRYQPYDASDKKPEESGLLSKIYLYPVRTFMPKPE
jgi:hypothetical protein